ncbi:hypothetical protein BDV93DRAFT_519918 [Ceratobasidium sp. AG-I]|nr:hypothetical protein BDV93DRAFT_519918 [Ceratobasidium sp. AG-I]
MNVPNQSARVRIASTAARPTSPVLGGMSGVDTCEQLLFRVIASVQSMKTERETIILDREQLQNEIERLQDLLHEQEEIIEQQRAEIERLTQAQAPNSDSFALCLVDGDGCIFNKNFLVNGYDGGKEAASALTKHIHQDIGNASTTLWTCVYYNHYGLKKALAKAKIVQESVFDEFCDGFRSASQLIHMMDVGRRKEAADEKIKEMLRTFVTTPQTRVVYFGGGHDSGYGGALSHYQNLGFEDKIVILKGYAELAYDLRNLPFKTISSDSLFMQEKIDTESSGSLTGAFSTASNVNQNAPVFSYASAATLVVPKPVSVGRSPSPGHSRRPSRELPRGGQRRIDTSKPLHKQTPSICNYYYLSSRGCRNVSVDCQHAHDYALNDEQKHTLHDYMQTVPCDHGNECINEACILGHHCPSGLACLRFKRGICKFADDQHFDLSDENNSLR